MKTILHLHEQGLAAIERGVDVTKIFAIECREQITRSSYVDEKELSKITGIRTTIDEQIRAIG
jgi:vacuolar-type H+-ATPase catalytic subunit A/Vma1